MLVSAIAFVVHAPSAAADSVYRTDHTRLRPTGDAPLRSAFVQTIKAHGPTIHTYEIYVLNGAVPDATNTASNDFLMD